MNLLDVNVLLALLYEDHVHHTRARGWWQRTQDSGVALTVPDIVWVGVIRLATDARLFPTPVTHAEAWGFVRTLMSHPHYLRFTSEPGVLDDLERLVSQTHATGGMVTDAYIAATAARLGAAVVTFDRDFRKFDGVRVIEPPA